LTADLALFVASFALILVGSELFTNGVEWAGEKLDLAEDAVGSLLAAVGTALPETLIPAVAFVMGRGHPGPHSQVGVGAIVGAPLMLSTVALPVMGFAALAFRKRRGRVVLQVAREAPRRDLAFFIPVFMVLMFLGGPVALPTPMTRRILAATLLAVYLFYAWKVAQITRSAEAEVEHGLYFESLLRGDPDAPRGWATACQVLAGTAAILAGAREFVARMVVVAARADLSPGVLSLILSPLATELPEKYNSVVWIRQRKDHLALANITGAMVFQSCLPVALGLAFTPWRLSPAELLAGGIALCSASLLYINLRRSKLETPALMAGGVAYGAFLAGLGLLGAL
jgi:cation:H+ antiporter